MTKQYKMWKSPKDETRDHMNFLQHLAGSKHVDVNPSGSQTKFDTNVQAHGEYLYITKASGRIPFNASLLTAGQVKFSAHAMSAKVRENLQKSLIKRDAHSEDKTGRTGNASCDVYDNVYGILENKRAAHKAADHFGRPKILSDHLKEVKETTLDISKTYGRSTQLNGVNGKDHRVDWNELRGYIYGTKTLRDIKDPIIEDLIRRNRDEIKTASTTLNPTTTILTALKIASNFWVTTETGGGGIITGDKDEDGKEQEYDSEEDAIIDIVKDTTNKTASQQIAHSQADPNRATAGIDALDGQTSFDDVVNDYVDTAEQIKQAQTLSSRCDGGIKETKHHIYNHTPTLKIDIDLDSTKDVAGKMLGNTGNRVSRNAWKLSAFGDPNVFVKQPLTSSDIVVLVDISGSIGDLEWSRTAQCVADITTAIKDRFKDAHMYGFTSSRGNNDYTAELVPFGSGQFPHTTGGTPLCGAMKGLERLHNLSEAGVLVITDGVPNMCKNGSVDYDANVCCQLRARAWTSRGVRFGTIYVGGSHNRRDEPLPVEMAVKIDAFKWKYGNQNAEIARVFEFFRR